MIIFICIYLMCPRAFFRLECDRSSVYFFRLKCHLYNFFARLTEHTPIIKAIPGGESCVVRLWKVTQRRKSVSAKESRKELRPVHKKTKGGSRWCEEKSRYFPLIFCLCLDNYLWTSTSIQARLGFFHGLCKSLCFTWRHRETFFFLLSSKCRNRYGRWLDVK